MDRRVKYTLIIGAIIALAILPRFLSSPYLHGEYGEYLINIHFVDNFTNSLVTERRNIPQDYSLQDAIAFVLDEMSNPTVGLSSILEYTQVLDFSVNQDYLSLALAQNYHQMSPYQEITTRAGLVYTFTELEQIENIRIYVGANPLLSSTGIPLGNLNRQNTVLFPNLDPVAVTAVIRPVYLYFVDPGLAGLYYQRVNIRILSDISIEEQVLGELFSRAQSGLGVMFLSPELRILDVNVIEDIAYIDLSYHFDTPPLQGETAQLLTIYAIVNTLTSLDFSGVNITEIEFLVEGQKLTEHQGYIDLAQSFVRNESLIIREELYEE